MFVKWERHEIQNGRSKAYRLEAFLEFQHQDEKKMNKKVLEYLCSIEERFLKCKEVGVRSFHQGIFWAKLDKRLDELSLESAGRVKVEEQISEYIPKPDSDWSLWCVRCVPKYES